MSMPAAPQPLSNKTDNIARIKAFFIFFITIGLSLSVVNNKIITQFCMLVLYKLGKLSFGLVSWTHNHLLYTGIWSFSLPARQGRYRTLIAFLFISLFPNDITIPGIVKWKKTKQSFQRFCWFQSFFLLSADLFLFNVISKSTLIITIVVD